MKTVNKTPPNDSKQSRLIRLIKAQVPQKTVRDIINRIKYGADAPQSDECLYINPNTLELRFQPSSSRQAAKFRRRASGRVLAGDWDMNTAPWNKNAKYASCEMRFIHGEDWKNTPAYQDIAQKIYDGHGHDGCSTIAELDARYQALDRLWDTISSSQRLTPRAELSDGFRREHGGILVHFDRIGRPMRFGGGFHRFSIARLAKLPYIPVQVGVVHEDFVKSGGYATLRNPVD